MKKIKTLVLACTLVLFSSCHDESFENSSQNIVVENSLNHYLPKGFKGVSTNDITLEQIKNKEVTEKAVIISSKNEVVDDFKLELLKEATLNNVPILIEGDANKLKSITSVTGIDPREAGFFFIYHKENEGVSSEFFPLITNTQIEEVVEKMDLDTIEVSPEVKEEINTHLRAQNYSEEQISKEWKEFDLLVAASKKNKANQTNKKKSLKKNSQVISWEEDASAIIKDDLLNKRHKNTNSISSKSNTPDVTKYAYRSGYFHLRDTRLGHNSSINYRVKWSLARGTYPGSSEERIFISSEFVPNPGVRVIAKNGWGRGNSPFCTFTDKIENLLDLFKIAITIPNEFSYDGFGPIAGSVGSGSYSSSLNASIKIKPLKHQELIEFSFGYSTSYSYSMPSFYFTNQTQTGHRKNMFWQWTPGNVVKGAFEGGKGLLRRYVHSIDAKNNLFVRTHEAPVPMRQTNAIQTHQLVSAPKSSLRLDGNGLLSTPFEWETEARIIEVNAIVKLVILCISGVPEIESTKYKGLYDTKQINFDIKSLD